MVILPGAGCYEVKNVVKSLTFQSKSVSLYDFCKNKNKNSRQQGDKGRIEIKADNTTC